MKTAIALCIAIIVPGGLVILALRFLYNKKATWTHAPHGQFAFSH